jgi:hypothetical protein
MLEGELSQRLAPFRAAVESVLIPTGTALPEDVACSQYLRRHCCLPEIV